MASARQKNGKWYYRITLTVGDGSHKYVERGSFRTKKEALEAGNKLELLYKDGEDISRPKIMSFNFLQNEWRQSAKSSYKKSSYLETIKVLERDIVPYLKDYNISAIDLKVCQGLIDIHVKNRRSRNSLRRIRGVLNAIFKYAIKQGYLKTNPMDLVTLPAVRSENGRKLYVANHTKVIPKEEIEAIFKRFPEGYPDYIPLILGYRCGLRIGEAFGVLIDDVDTKNKILHVRHQVYYDENSNLVFTEPKFCKPGEGRDIALDDNTNRILERHINRLIELSSVMRYYIYRIDENGVLNLKKGKIVSPINIRFKDGTYVPPRSMEYVSRIIHGKLSHIDVVDPNWDFHSLRHTHASECIAAGMDPVSVQKRLGHKDLSTTYKYYVHETPDEVKNSVEKLNQMFK